jgi:hypothetical protein
MTTIDTQAAAVFVDTFSDGMLSGDVGIRFGCGEIEALAGMLRALGADEAAARWIADHATDDDEGDMHYAGTAAGYACKSCGGPSPVGVGYVDDQPGAAEASAQLTRCACGQSQLATTEPI